ncbi:hypothetical protein, partial [Klebsiella pneumoniae]|uniref:hypothetical protein n=1 Tax=Klebsiella pneumoniae TaxID=573 RepID=UPI00358E4DA7
TDWLRITFVDKAMSGFHAVPVKVAAIFLTEIEASILKFTSSNKRPRIAKRILRKKNKAQCITFSDLNIEDEELGMETAQAGMQNRHTEPWNRIKSPEV